MVFVQWAKVVRCKQPVNRRSCSVWYWGQRGEDCVTYILRYISAKRLTEFITKTRLLFLTHLSHWHVTWHYTVASQPVRTCKSPSLMIKVDCQWLWLEFFCFNSITVTQIILNWPWLLTYELQNLISLSLSEDEGHPKHMLPDFGWNLFL